MQWLKISDFLSLDLDAISMVQRSQITGSLKVFYSSTSDANQDAHISGSEDVRTLLDRIQAAPGWVKGKTMVASFELDVYVNMSHVAEVSVPNLPSFTGMNMTLQSGLYAAKVTDSDEVAKVRQFIGS